MAVCPVPGRALLLAAVGNFGVISFTVVPRTEETGIRIALGAALAVSALLACVMPARRATLADARRVE